MIHSSDFKYGQYLKSLVQQVHCDPELTVLHKSELEIQPDDTAQDKLHVLYLDSGPETWDSFLQELPARQMLVITNNGQPRVFNNTQARFFSRPLNGYEFVKEVHQWCQSRSAVLLAQQEAPVEPFLVGNSKPLRMLRKNISRISSSDLTVLVCGPTGTGKGVVAQALHNNSARRCNKFLDINCANVPSSLLESELFGYRKGSFTGAWQDKVGRFELVQEGTIFLDEVSEMSTYMQAKLLQVLQEKEFYPVGGMNSVEVKARMVAATNADLQKAIDQGTFREDLYYRLAVVRLDLPRLKERKEDIPALVQHFLDRFCRLFRKLQVPSLSDKVWDLLLTYDWPGNVRELESSIKNLVVMGNEELIQDELYSKLHSDSVSKQDGHLQAGISPDPGRDMGQEQKIMLQDMSLKEIAGLAASKAEAEIISRALQRTGGKKKMAAELLDISYKCLLKKLKIYGL